MTKTYPNLGNWQRSPGDLYAPSPSSGSIFTPSQAAQVEYGLAMLRRMADDHRHTTEARNAHNV